MINDNWLKIYEKAKEYYMEHNDLSIPKNYYVKIGDDKIVKLDVWLYNQKNAYKNRNKLDYKRKITDEQIMLLEQIGIIWEISEFEWMKSYELAKKYYEKHGNLFIPSDTNLANKKISSWIIRQRRLFIENKLNDEKIKLLNEIGMVWSNVKSEKCNSTISKNWMKNYELAKKYYEEHGNLLINLHYKTLDEDNNNVNLGYWINIQRLAKRYRFNNYPHKINDEQIKLLNDINMCWDKEERNNYIIASNNWLKHYILAKDYYLKYGNLNVPNKYEVNDNEKKIFKLGKWISHERYKYKNNLLNENQIKLFNEIKMIWNIKEYKKVQKIIEKKYLDFLYNKLQEQEINELINNKIFYKDKENIIKGNAYEIIKEKGI